MTEPTCATRPMSLRSRSTIITFSARFLVSTESRRAISLSPSGASARAAVPFMGRAVSTPASWRKNSSGEQESTWVASLSPALPVPSGKAISAP